MRQLDITKSPEESEVLADIGQHRELQEVTRVRTNMIWLAAQV